MTTLCDHGDQISKFCLDDACTQKQCSGCETCMAKFHNHSDQNQILTQKQVLNAMKKFNLDPNLKPKCRSLQQAIYNYFTKTKTQIISFLDSLCKLLINEIGLPFLYKTNNWACYKRIKHRQYRKIIPKELKRLIAQSIKTDKNNLIEKQCSLYFQATDQIKKKLQYMQRIFTELQKLEESEEFRFKREKNNFNRINHLFSNIQESKASTFEYMKNILKIQGKQQPKKSSPITPRGMITKKASRQRLTRKLSIDQTLQKTKFFQLKKIPDDRSNSKQKKLVNSSTNKSFQAEKQRLINKKNEDLPMKYSLNVKNQKCPSPSNSSPMNMNRQRSQRNKINNITENSSSSSQKKEIQDEVKHTILPQVQSEKKISTTDIQIKQRTFMYPIQKINTEQCESPLIKMKKKQKISPVKLIENLERKKLQRHSPSKQNLKESELRSLALLIKSINMKSQQAIPHLQSAIRYASNNLTAAEYLSFLYLDMGRPKQCLALCSSILDKFQNSRQHDDLSYILCNNKASAYNMLGRYSQAIVLLKRCLHIKQQDVIYKNLGDSYFSIGIYEKATQNYEKAVQLKQTNDEAYYNLAVCYFVQQDLQNSANNIQKAIKLKPKNTVYQQLKAQIKYKKNQF